MLHYLYKTTNLINSKFYIGMHSANNVSDTYLGSGKLIRSSLKKYGRENHGLEILQFYDSRSALSQAEKDYITDEMLNNPSCLNLKAGGEDVGFTGGKHSRESKSKISKSNIARFADIKNREALSNKLAGRTFSDETKAKMKTAKLNMSEETKAKMSESKKGVIPTWSCKSVIVRGIEYQSISHAARELNVNRHTIRKILQETIYSEGMITV